MSVQERQELRRDRTRAEILDAAWELAERDGLVSMSLRDLAAAVGMRAPSLYTYFGGKDAIYDAMFSQGYEQLIAAQDGWLADTDGQPSRARLTHALQQWLDFCQASVPRYQLLFTTVVPGWQPSPGAYATSVRAYERMVAAFETLGTVDPETLDLYTALASGLAAQQLANDPDGDRWRRLVPEAMQMFLDHVERRESR